MQHPDPTRSSRAHGWALPALALVLAVSASLAPEARDKPTPAFEAGFETITEDEVQAYVEFFASPALEGRDTPSTGLTAALEHGAAKLESYGYRGLGPEGSFLAPWRYPRELEAPIADECNAGVLHADGSSAALELGVDYVPLPGANGAVSGEVVFLGFGIHRPKDKYDDLRGGKLKGKIAMFLSEEPRHKKVLDGPEISDAANAYEKLDDLEDEGLIGAIIVRRPAAPNLADEKQREKAEPTPAQSLGFRYTWATWNDQNVDRPKAAKLPAIEVSVAFANELLGEDVLELAERMDKRAKTERVDVEDVTLSFDVKTKAQPVDAHNLVGFLEGSDPELMDEVVVLGAHFDHLGMDARGRMAAGADDNGSGSAALLEVAEALSLAKPRRSILIAGFAGEEDGLLGAYAMANEPPVDKGRLVAMLNMDMIGRGKANSVVVLGADKNRDMEDALERGDDLEKTGIRKIITNKGGELWQRSDHYAFHSAGVPVLFFFEAVPISDNEDYHTWRDVPELVDFEKVTNTARLVYNTAWILAQDDERPSFE